MSSLQERIRIALAESNLKNPAALAKNARVSRATVSLWINGPTQTIEGDKLTRAAAALGVDAHWLATGEGSRHKDIAHRVEQVSATYASPIGAAPTIAIRTLRQHLVTQPRPVREAVCGLVSRYLLDDNDGDMLEIIEAAINRLLQNNTEPRGGV